MGHNINVYVYMRGKELVLSMRRRLEEAKLLTPEECHRLVRLTIESAGGSG